MSVCSYNFLFKVNPCPESVKHKNREQVIPRKSLSTPFPPSSVSFLTPTSQHSQHSLNSNFHSLNSFVNTNHCPSSAPNFFPNRLRTHATSAFHHLTRIFPSLSLQSSLKFNHLFSHDLHCTIHFHCFRWFVFFISLGSFESEKLLKYHQRSVTRPISSQCRGENHVYGNYQQHFNCVPM
jgi:hypothetical protein